MTSAKDEPNILLKEKGPGKKAQDFYVFEKKKKDSFTIITGPQTHLIRRQMILKKYPDVLKLMQGTSYISYYLAVAVVLAQLSLAYYLRTVPWLPWLLITYVVGGTLAHTSHVLVHDFVHFTGNTPPNLNRFFAIMCNVSLGIPSAMSFGKFHADHHNFMGEYGKDPDLPLDIEAKYVNTRIRKGIFLFFIAFVYAFRPVFCYKSAFTIYQAINYVVVISIDFLILIFLGPMALMYILICGFLSIGPHPTAFHILAEHFEFVPEMETYDYIGNFNIVNLNVGYHIEHHDFPTIPWYNLPKLRAMAPQFYEQFPVHTDYLGVAYKFVMDDNFGLYNRILRFDKKVTG